MKFTILGAGAWGTALAIHTSSQHLTTLWTRNESHISDMRRTLSNNLYLQDSFLQENILLESDLKKSIENAEIIICAVPSSGLRNILKFIKEIKCKTPIIWASKGLEKDTAKLPYEIAAEELEKSHLWGALSGPTFAHDLTKKLPTAATIATTDKSFASKVGASLHNNNFRIYTDTDVKGVSIGGALKNIMAIAVGISDGMQFGDNARAALMTRGLAEMVRFGTALGGKQTTFMGLTGIGDLVLTCTGKHSRNKEVGMRLARGEKLNDILQKLGHVAEGVNATKEVLNRATKLNIDMPITNEVNQVLFHNLSPAIAVEKLLQRSQKNEFY